MVIRRIGVYSLGKIVGAVYSGLGLVAGAIISLVSVFGLVSSAGDGFGQEDTAVFFGLSAILFVPLFYGTLGFIGGLLSAALYNFAARLVVGLELEVR